jgi:hypothetical protein
MMFYIRDSCYYSIINRMTSIQDCKSDNLSKTSMTAMTTTTTTTTTAAAVTTTTTTINKRKLNDNEDGKDVKAGQNLNNDMDLKSKAEANVKDAIRSLSKITMSDLKLVDHNLLRRFFKMTRKAIDKKDACIPLMMTARLVNDVFPEILEFFQDFVEPPGVPNGEVMRCLKLLIAKTKCVFENGNMRGPLTDFRHQDYGWERTISIDGIEVTASCSSCTVTKADAEHYDELSIEGHQSLSSFRKALNMPQLPLGILLFYIVWCLEPEWGYNRDHSMNEENEEEEEDDEEDDCGSNCDWRKKALAEWTKDVKEDFQGYLMVYDDTDFPVLAKELIISRLSDRWVLVKAKQLPLIESCHDPQFVRYQKMYNKNPNIAIRVFEHGV